MFIPFINPIFYYLILIISSILIVFILLKEINTWKYTLKDKYSVKIIINNQEIQNCLIGLSKEEFSLEQGNCLLPNKLKEELCL